jgi:hypothetical protein
MHVPHSYTLLLTDGSYYIDETAAQRVREAIRLDVDQFLIFTKVCGTSEPDRLVSIKADAILTLIAHETVRRRLPRASAVRGLRRVQHA